MTRKKARCPVCLCSAEVARGRVVEHWTVNGGPWAAKSRRCRGAGRKPAKPVRSQPAPGWSRFLGF